MAIVERINEHQALLKNPATNEDLYTLDFADKAAVDKAVSLARQAQKSWGQLSVAQRVEHLLALRDLIIEKREWIIETIVAETGKVKIDALAIDVFPVCAMISYWCKQATKTLRPEVKRASGILGFLKKVHIFYKPLGVVGVISPWNGPFVLTASPCIQAMLAGNTVVAKGSEVTPMSAKIFETLCLEAGLPEGVCQVLIGDGAAGAALTQANVDKISFTGSVATGKRVGVACAQRLIPCALELGGNDAMIVCDDANLDHAAHGAVWGSFINTGHYCCGIERVYVEAPVYDAFVSKVTAIVNALKQGAEHDYQQDVGAVFWDKQLALIESHVTQAIEKGAKVLVGGKAKPGNGLYFQPTVMTELDETCDLMTQETFGPILPIVKVNNAKEALEKANDSEFGLHGSIWTQDKAKALAMAQCFESGSVSINDIGIVFGISNVPFGGIKNSGLGKVHGEFGLRNYTNAMPVAIGRYTGLNSGYPHDEKKYNNVVNLINFMWKNPVGRFFFGP